MTENSYSKPPMSALKVDHGVEGRDGRLLGHGEKDRSLTQLRQSQGRATRCVGGTAHRRDIKLNGSH